MATWISSTHSIYALQLPTWLNNAGMSKGIYHDKQNLGVILDPGITIRAKHLGTADDPAIELSLLNDDGSKEQYISLNNEFCEFTSTHTSAAFISTPYRESASNIEIVIEYSSPPKSLPVHKTGTDTADFFKFWDDQASAFALISTRYADILVPAKDKPHLKRLHESTGMVHLENYFQGIFELFNHLAGLSFSPNTPTDKNVPNRYFMKANKTGLGSAYYGHDHTAETNDSVASFWLNPDPKNWGSIHEIGHGYQGLFMDYSEIPLGEVWNNLYAYYYQAQHLGDDLFKDSWLYHGEQDLHFDLTEQLFERNPAISTWQLHELLYYLILILDKAGLSALIDYNKAYRAACNRHDFHPRDYSFIEMFIDSCAKTSNIDISPLLRIGQISTSRINNLVTRYANRIPVYPLYKLAPREKLSSLVKQLNLASRIDLIDNIALKDAGLMGNVELVLDNKLYDAFYTKDFLLRNGTNLSTIININAQKITVPNLAAGVYTLQAPSICNGKLYTTTQHIDVRGDITNSINIEYKYISGAKLASQTIELYGLYTRFVSIEIDPGEDCITIDIHANAPHSYYADRIYSSITIKDRHQRTVFQQVLHGNSVTTTKEKITAAPDYTIEIFHAEPSRNKIFPASELVLDAKNTLVILTMTPQGLYNKQIGTPTGENLAREIEKLSATINAQPHFLLYRDHPLLDELYVAINSFNDVKHNQLLEKYKDLYLKHQNSESRFVTGTNFSWNQGAHGGNIATIEFNLAQEIINIEVYPAAPHVSFASVYLAIWIHNKKGNILFCQELRGTSIAEHTSLSLPFTQGSEINIFHAEHTRSPIINQTTKEQYEIKQRHRVYALERGKLAI